MATDYLCLSRPFTLARKIRGYDNHNAIKRVLHRTVGTPVSIKVVRAMATDGSFGLTAERRSANYQPNTWSHEYLQSLASDHSVETCESQLKRLEEEVKKLINKENQDLLTTLELIDDAQRLGLGYKLDRDIRTALDRIYFSAGALDDLHATSLCFRLLRQHGYEVSQDVFNKFKDEDGNLITTSLEEDKIKAILSLHEASHFAIEGESFLEKAQSFTKSTLRDYLKNNENKNALIGAQVSHALELPLNRRMPRLEARWSIEMYTKRKDANQPLLELAVLDFNMVQSVLRRELGDMSRWWRSLGLSNKLSFARDRLLESFFWALGMIFEPQYGNCRAVITKVFALITVFDDVYDVYGTLEELELLTDAVHRWDLNAVNDLPDYLKLCFLALYNTTNEMAYEILKEKGENLLPYLIKGWADLCKSFLQEARWIYNKVTPTYEEYLENAWMTSTGPLQLVHANLFLSGNRTKEELDGLQNYHDLLRWPSIIFRLTNDLASASAELERGETTNSVILYMKKAGVTEAVAHKYVRNRVDETWKKLNKERIGDSLTFNKPFIETCFNLARISHCVYQYGDGHSSPDERSRKRVLSVIIEPISLAPDSRKEIYCME